MDFWTTDRRGAVEIEVMQSDDGQLALKTFLAEDPASRRDWFETAGTKTYPAYSGS